MRRRSASVGDVPRCRYISKTGQTRGSDLPVGTADRSGPWLDATSCCPQRSPANCLASVTDKTGEGSACE
jgi:hypothetical protein